MLSGLRMLDHESAWLERHIPSLGITHDPVPSSNSFHHRCLYGRSSARHFYPEELHHPVRLPLAFDNSFSVDLNVLATPFPKHDGLLKRVIPCVLLPILHIICELQMLDLPLPTSYHSTHPNLAIQMDMNVVQPGKIEDFPNDEGLILWQVERATVVRLQDAVEELL